MRTLIHLLHGIPLLVASLVVAGCSSSYHPEYHPVTVSNFSQNLSYPVAVNNGGSASQPAPVYVMPGPPQSAVAAPAFVAPPAALPADFFH